MNETELITITAASSDCETAVVKKVIDIYLDTIAAALATQDRVELRTDFGSFVVREKGGAADTDGGTIAKVQRVVSFKATPTLKKKLRQSDETYWEQLHKKGAFLQIERLKKKAPKED